MADTVRRLLEEMVPELVDLEERGYFSKSEIKGIVKKRQNFEYALRRRAALKVDYTRYIEYEVHLEKLRQVRRKERNIKGKPSLADHCIVRRIHFIYERALRKFKGDLTLWAQWIHYCQVSKSFRQMSRVLLRALQLHPSCAALWTYAAAWEFEHNRNATAARALMQRGLRMCKDIPALWHEYFRMELLYAAQLYARREVLGLTDLNYQATGSEGTTRSEDGSHPILDPILHGAVAKVVYKSAIEKHPDSLSFKLEFLKVLDSIKLDTKYEVEELIVKDIVSTFGHAPQVVAMQAQRSMEKALHLNADLKSKLMTAMDIFISALKSSPSPELNDAYFAFLEHQSMLALKSEDSEVVSFLIEACTKATSQAVAAGYATEYVLLATSRLHQRVGKFEDALAIVRTGLSTHPASRLLLREASYLETIASCFQETRSSLTSVLANQVLSNSKQDDAEMDIHPLIFEAAVRESISLGNSVNAFCDELIIQQRRRGKGGLDSPLGNIAAFLFNVLWITQGPHHARHFFKTLKSMPLPGGALIHSVLDAEIALVKSQDSNALPVKKIREEIFEVGASAYGSEDQDLWLRWWRFEQMQDGGKNVASVHWRAVKSLKDADAFVSKTQLMSIGLV
jgi:U3 small nucleolar RNA-associated protein 6